MIRSCTTCSIAPRVRFLTWSKGAQAIRARAGHANALTDDEIAATDMGGDDVIAINPQYWPKPRVLLEMFFGVGERDGLHEAAAWHPRRHRLVLGDTRTAATALVTATAACAAMRRWLRAQTVRVGSRLLRKRCT